MQDRYVGDIGDFGKYGLLNALCMPSAGSREPEFRLGVVWYLYPDEEQNGDGRFTEYLRPSDVNREAYRACDPILYDMLGKIVFNDERNVSSLPKHQILPPTTVYYEAPLTFEGLFRKGPLYPAKLLDHRKKWVEDGLEATAGCDLVFIDPDNGLEIKSTPRHHRRGPKYCAFDELEPCLARGQSLVIYQHLGHHQPADLQINAKLRQIEEILGPTVRPFALRFRRGSSRAYLVVPSTGHSQALWRRAQRFVHGPWGQNGHFDLVLPRERIVL